MTASIINFINELRAEKAAGNDMAEQLVGRIDAHIRDLETLKAWVLDSATARSMAIDGMLGIEAPAPVPAAVKSQDEAA